VTYKIELENMEFFAYHGCYKEEQVVGNRFLVNLSMETTHLDAIKTDKLKDALNYQKAYEIVKKEVEIPSHLLEHVCGRILDSLFSLFAELDSATVKLSKLNPPMGGKMERVSVTLSRRR
jgi:dihydroneopterin aldolase